MLKVGEMTQWFRVLAVFAEIQGPIPGTLIVAHSHGRQLQLQENMMLSSGGTVHMWCRHNVGKIPVHTE